LYKWVLETHSQSKSCWETIKGCALCSPTRQPAEPGCGVCKANCDHNVIPCNGACAQWLHCNCAGQTGEYWGLFQGQFITVDMSKLRRSGKDAH